METGFRIYFTDKTVHFKESELNGEAKGNTTLYTVIFEGITILWKREDKNGYTEFSLSLSSKNPLNVKRIDSIVFTVPTVAITDHVTFLGRSFTKNEIRFPHELMVNTEYSCTATGIYPELTQKGTLLAGVVPFTNIFNAVFEKKDDGSVILSAATEYTEGSLLNTRLEAERAILLKDKTLNEFFDIYRPLVPVSTFPMPKLTGWNTWDYYLDRVTPEDIFENVNALKKLPFKDRFKYIVIDDGWQKAWGDWKENEKFACGLKKVADSIREAGFVPGIWMAPVMVQYGQPLINEHPEWFVADDEGTKYLDPTIPCVEEMILDNYRYQYAAGFRLFKLDYVSPLLRVKDFYDKTLSAYGVLASLIEKVKAATGPDAVVLGCSLSPECGSDIAPSMRIGVDIHNHFPHVEAIARAMTWAWMYNNRITRIDPDFIVVRGEETSTEPLIWEEGKRTDFIAPPRHLQTDTDRKRVFWRNGPQFSFIEAETWAYLSVMSGGNLFLSDRLSKLNERGISIISSALEAECDEVRPVFTEGDTRVPSMWVGDKALLIINWTDVPKKMTFNTGKKLRSRKPFTEENGTFTVHLLPHESFCGIYE
jgi:hypothetical protein